MSFILADRVKESCSSPGTGTVTLLGAATGYQSFSAGIGASNTTYYVIADQSGSNWEVGLGTIGAGGTTLARTTVLSSSNSGSLVNFSSGTQDVFCDYPAGKAVYKDASNNVTGYAISGGTIDNTPIGATTASTGAFTYASTSSTTNTTPALGYNASNSSFVNGATVSGSYLQNVMQNKSGTAGASTNFVVSNDLGTDSTYYGEFGMNSSVYSSGTPADFFSLNNGVYFSGHYGDISIGSGNGYKTYLAWGTTGQSAHVINASGALGLSTNLGTTPALSGTTGYGTSGQVLTSAGSAAAPTWTTPLSIGGSNTQVQYNSSGVLAGSANMTFNGTTLTLAKDASINGVTVGLGGGSVSSNTAVGNNAIGTSNTGVRLVGIGQGALVNNTSGIDNVSLGQGTLYNNLTGSTNFAGGGQSLYSNTSGSNNSASGFKSLFSNISGSGNCADGYFALTNNTTASNLTAFGTQALINNTTNVATLGTITGGSSYTNGTYTGVVMTLSSGSTALTYPTATIVVSGGAVTTVTITSAGAGFKDTTTVLTAPAASIGGTGSGFSVPVATLNSGTGNVAVGYQAGYSNTTGTSNTFTGYQAGYLNNSGINNCYYGYSAGYNSTSGTGNCSFGINSLSQNQTSSNNTTMGLSSGYNITSGNNVGIGSNSLYNLSSNGNCTGIGVQSLYATTGANNIGIGYFAGRGPSPYTNANTTGTNNTYIGYQTVGSANNNTNEMVIGYQAVGLGSNTTVIGNTSTTLTQTYGVTKSTNYTVATLPSASTSGVGARAFVTDALAPSFGVAVTGGGAVPIPVYSTGSAWNVG